MELRDQASYTANQSSEEVEGELMEHGYVVGMKLSNVVLHNIIIIIIVYFRRKE